MIVQNYINKDDALVSSHYHDTDVVILHSALCIVKIEHSP